MIQLLKEYASEMKYKMNIETNPAKRGRYYKAYKTAMSRIQYLLKEVDKSGKDEIQKEIKEKSKKEIKEKSKII